MDHSISYLFSLRRKKVGNTFIYTAHNMQNIFNRNTYTEVSVSLHTS